MIQRTLGDVLPQIAAVCGASGMKVSDARVITRINEAIEELMNEADTPGVVDRWHIIATDGNIVLPPNYDRIMNVSIAGVPTELKSNWFEFVQGGPGPAENEAFRWRWWCGVDGLLERGEQPTQTLLPEISCGSGCSDGSAVPAGPWFMRVYATEMEETGAYLTAQGTYQNQMVRTQIADGSGLGDGSATEWINGERIPIDFSVPYTEGTKPFDKITTITKPQTNGYVRLTAWNGVDEIPLSDYAPWETTPSYRRYFSPWLQTHQLNNPCCRVVRATVRKRFVPVEELTDPLIITNVPALKSMVIAQWKRDAGEMDQFAQYKVVAVDIMKKEAVAYRGKSRVPAITVQRGFGYGTNMAAIR